MVNSGLNQMNQRPVIGNTFGANSMRGTLNELRIDSKDSSTVFDVYDNVNQFHQHEK